MAKRTDKPNLWRLPKASSKTFWKRMAQIHAASYCQQCDGNTPTVGNQRPKCGKCGRRR